METWVIGLQIVTTLLVLMTIGVYFLQWRTMQRQLDAAQEQVRVAQGGVSAQNFFALISYLQDPEARDSRAWVLQKLAEKPFEHWDDQDRAYASRVCSKYDVVGSLIRYGMVPREAVIGSWGTSIRRCREVLIPFIEKMKEKNGGGYWGDFDWLYAQSIQELD